MFEGYSERARQVIFLARWMSGQRGSNVVEMDDLVLALIKEDQGSFATTLSVIPQFQHFKALPHKAYLHADLANDLLRRIDAILPRSQPLPLDAEIPLSRSGKEVLGKAGDLLSEGVGQPLTPLHLLAAILAIEQPSKGVELLKEVGITETKVLEDIKGGADNSG